MLRDAKYLVLAAAVIASTIEPADASIFRMRIEDIGAGVGAVVTDNGPGDLDPSPDLIVFSSAIGAFSVTVTTGTASPINLAAGFLDNIDLDSVSASTTAAGGSLRIVLEKDDFAGAPDGVNALLSSFGGLLTAPIGSTIDLQSWSNPGNLMPALGPDQLAGAIAPIVFPPPPAGSAATALSTVGPGAFFDTESTTFTKSGAYSIFSSATISLTGPGSATFDHLSGAPIQVSPNETVPEPISLAIWAGSAGLAGVIAYLRRRAAG